METLPTGGGQSSQHLLYQTVDIVCIGRVILSSARPMAHNGREEEEKMKTFKKPGDRLEFEQQMAEAIKDIDIRPRQAAVYHADWLYGAFSTTGLFRYRFLDEGGEFLCMDNKLKWSLLRKTSAFLPKGDWTMDVTHADGTILVSIRW